jgi:hypothetical protein
VFFRAATVGEWLIRGAIITVTSRDALRYRRHAKTAVK